MNNSFRQEINSLLILSDKVISNPSKSAKEYLETDKEGNKYITSTAGEFVGVSSVFVGAVGAIAGGYDGYGETKAWVESAWNEFLEGLAQSLGLSSLLGVAAASLWGGPVGWAVGGGSLVVFGGYKYIQYRDRKKEEKERALREVVKKQQAIIEALKKQNAENTVEIKNLKDMLRMLEETEQALKNAT